MRMDVHDWDLHTAGPLLVFVPSAKTKARQYLVTLFAAVLIAGICWYYGLPPGARKVSRQQDRVEQVERRLEAAQDQLDAFEQGTGFGELHQARVEGAERQVEARQREVDLERSRLSATAATLGPAGDTLYWSGIVLLAVVGLGYPQLARFERVVIRSGDGRVRIRSRLQPWAARTLEADRCAAIAVRARRLIGAGKDAVVVSDHGWAWSVALLPASGGSGQPLIELVCDHEHFLDNQPNDLTRRVRDTVQFFECATGLTAQSAVVSDVVKIDREGRKTYRSRRHG